MFTTRFLWLHRLQVSSWLSFVVNFSFGHTLRCKKPFGESFRISYVYSFASHKLPEFLSSRLRKVNCLKLISFKIQLYTVFSLSFSCKYLIFIFSIISLKKKSKSLKKNFVINIRLQINYRYFWLKLHCNYIRLILGFYGLLYLQINNNFQ